MRAPWRCWNDHTVFLSWGYPIPGEGTSLACRRDRPELMVTVRQIFGQTALRWSPPQPPRLLKGLFLPSFVFRLLSSDLKRSLEKPKSEFTPFCSMPANTPTHMGVSTNPTTVPPSSALYRCDGPGSNCRECVQPRSRPQQPSPWSSLPMNDTSHVSWTIGRVIVTILYPQGTDHSSPGVDTGLQSTTLHMWIQVPWHEPWELCTCSFQG